jgi:exodeoxyribonuclease V alpha subunit
VSAFGFLRAWDRQIAPPDRSQTELLGRVARLSKVWDNADGTFTVLADVSDRLTVRGTVDDPAELRPCGHYRFVGRWEEHPKWGWQFRFESFVADVPAEASGVIDYLSAHCPGIGDATARKLVERFGNAAVRVLVETPDLAAAEGLLRPEVARAAATALRSICDPALRDAHLELSALFKGLGFPRRLIKQVLAKWGAGAASRIRRDPFTLIVHDMPGTGFVRCDRLYLKVGGNPGRLKRQALAAWHAVHQRDGDTWISLADALAAVKARISGTGPRSRRALALAIKARWLDWRADAADDYWIAERNKAANEQTLARRLDALREVPACWPSGPFDGLSEHQQAEVGNALRDGPVVALTGSPGTGKTHCAAAVIRELERRHGAMTIAVAAPTGKAAVRITEKLQEANIGITATTIHRLLKVQQGGKGWQFAHDEDHPLPHRFVIVDEVSMLDTDLAAALFRALSPGTQVLLVGDVHQLPPVGHGAPLRDLLVAGLPAARLTEIRRNAGLIVESCALVKDGRRCEPAPGLSHWPEANLIHLAARGTQAMTDRLATVYEWLTQYRWDLIDQVQVICARNATRKKLNRLLQERLNPTPPAGHPVFRPGDKVINTRNGFFVGADPDGRPTKEYVANGDIGRVEAIHGRQLRVRLRAPDRLVTVPLGKATDGPAEDDAAEGGAPATGCAWDHAFACTVHKYQGSECPVVIVLLEPAGPLSNREWLYTAISRAKELCILIGCASEISHCTARTILPDRKTFLVEMLKESCTP